MIALGHKSLPKHLSKKCIKHEFSWDVSEGRVLKRETYI
jgi:hypothetical protein